MVVFPNGKINLGLHITGRRPDGYHDLETVFYPIGWKDVLEVVTDPHPAESDCSLTVKGLTVAGGEEQNLCVRAYRLLKQQFPHLPAVAMYLHKAIPMGAGLGGGSADGAFALVLLNRKYQLGLSSEQLMAYALQLGSDCPFFIQNQPCFASGRGEQLQPLPLNLARYHILIVHPGIHISTGWAFSQLQPGTPALALPEILRQPVHNWKHQLVNDFEAVVCRQHPEIAEIRDRMYAQGALYASLTGSGSAVYGIFPHAPQMQWPPHYSYHLTGA